MKRLTLIIIGVLLCTPLYSDMNPYIAGVPVSGGEGCLTDSVDQEQAEYGYNSGMYSLARGQSFVVSQAGDLSSIEIYFYHHVADADVELRWGTTANLTSSYVDSDTYSVTSTGWHKFTFDTKGAVSTSTTYYFACIITSGGDLSLGADNTEPDYTDGQYYYGTTGAPWNLTQTASGRDLAFRVYLCD